MVDTNKTEVVVIMDRSGSMSSIQSDMVGGFKTFMDEQRAEPGELFVSLYQFDTQFDVVYENKPAADVGELPLHPRSSTALLDAVGKTVTLVGERLAALPEEQRPGAVVVLIITDGLENASKEWKADAVRAAVERQEKEFSWKFVYLGADLAGLKDAASMGVTRAASYDASAQGVRGMYSGVSENLSRYRRSVRSGDSNADFYTPGSSSSGK